jgi:hypothetical protein
MPAAIKPENAPEMSDPQYNSAVRKASSLRVYHAVKQLIQPGCEIQSVRTVDIANMNVQNTLLRQSQEETCKQ